MLSNLKSQTNTDQAIFALIGDPVSHSLSPAMWNAAFAALSFAAVYLAFPVCRQNLPRAFAGLPALGIGGINVTRPHKNSVADLCDVLHYPADILQAVNTVKFIEGKSHGWNTDALALQKILRNVSAPKKALVLGSGGTAAAAIWALGQSGSETIFQISRKKMPRPSFLNQTSEFVWVEWADESLAAHLGAVDLIINATPLGWKKEDCLREFETKLNKHQTFIDVNYSDCSQLIASACKAGCEVIDGRELLVLQAVESFKLLTELEAPEKIMRSCIF